MDSLSIDAASPAPPVVVAPAAPAPSAAPGGLRSPFAAALRLFLTPAPDPAAPAAAQILADPVGQAPAAGTGTGLPPGTPHADGPAGGELDSVDEPGLAAWAFAVLGPPPEVTGTPVELDGLARAARPSAQGAAPGVPAAGVDAGLAQQPGALALQPAVPGERVDGVTAQAVDADVRSSGFKDAFANRVTWLVRHDAQVAELRLNPPELGPIQVKIALHQQEASISFGVHHDATREAVEAALPRLREMLAEQGLALGDVDVSARDFGGGSASGEPEPARRAGSGPGAGGEAGAAPLAVRVGEGLLDQYA